MGSHLGRSTPDDSSSVELPIKEWPYLDQEVLVASRSGKVCITCQWFRHHAGANCTPVVSWQNPIGSEHLGISTQREDRD